LIHCAPQLFSMSLLRWLGASALQNLSAQSCAIWPAWINFFSRTFWMLAFILLTPHYQAQTLLGPLNFRKSYFLVPLIPTQVTFPKPPLCFLLPTSQVLKFSSVHIPATVALANLSSWWSSTS
jgi:hypothetical protein